LDAKATTIEVKLKDMGIESIEVADNGLGITPSNFHSLALKHCTSKLQQFTDLTALQTFGFRGEALNALCELSEIFTISTKHVSQPIGAMLQFRKDGRSVLDQLILIYRLGSSLKVPLFAQLGPQ
jgi:DNA mismatch repair protein PMS2